MLDHQRARRLGPLAWGALAALLLAAACGGGSSPSAPAVTSLVPTEGPVAGGTVVTLTGTGFQAGAAVTFGGVSATVSAVSSSTVVVQTPPRSAGAVPVKVVNPDGQATTAPGSFTFLSPALCTAPVVTDVTGPWQLVAPSAWSDCDHVDLHAPALATDERLGLVLINAGGQDNATPSITLSGTAPFAAAASAPVADLAASAPLVLAPAADRFERGPIEVGQALMTARRREASRAWLESGAPLPSPATARLQALATAAAPAIGDKWTQGGVNGFCVYSLNDSKFTRRPATLRAVTPNALFYTTDDLGDPGDPNSKLGRVLRPVVNGGRPDLFETLASYYEGTVSAKNPAPVSKRIHAALLDNFGPPSDVDRNGRVIFLLTDLGRVPGASGGFTIGYFFSGDVIQPQDTSASCSGTGSNGADMLSLLDPSTFNAYGGYTFDKIIDEQTPGVMAHELQHDVTYNARCLLGSAGSAGCRDIEVADKDLWLNEGLSMVAEDLAGFGLHTANERKVVGGYLDCQRFPSNLCFSSASLTVWPEDAKGNPLGDPVGHYGGSHAFLRWLLDQAGDGCVTGAGGCARSLALVGSSLGSRATVAAASGLTFDETYARYATGALFSGEDPLFTGYPAYPAATPAPLFSFAPAPAPWAPLHTAVGRVGYTSLPRAAAPTSPFVTTLRNDGWNAFVTGVGQGSEVTLTVTSTASVKPRLAVVRFKGSLTHP